MGKPVIDWKAGYMSHLQGDKSSAIGYDVYKGELDMGPASITLILIYSIIAVMLLNMTYAARLTPELPCFPAFGGR
jgi:hypothetical protein